MKASCSHPRSAISYTGCGNAFCGGLVAGLQQGLALAEATALATGSASLMAQAHGVPGGGPARQREEVRRRAAAVQEHARLVAR